MDDWEKFNQISIPKKENFYSYLNMDNITDHYYTHVKRVFKDFQIGEHLDLYLKSDTLLLADVFENCRNKYVS